MIKLLGTAMIVLGSGSAGFGFARAVRAQLRQLNALLAALEAGLPDCSGVALGVDRVVMLALGAESIGEVIAFTVDRA